MDRNALIQNLKIYTTSFDEEKLFISRFLNLLMEVNCFYRSNLKEHITGSAWIVNHNFQEVLLVHHKKLNRWLQPGGHADGNENVLDVALKETKEETGIVTFLKVFPAIFDIDIHPIPERNEVSGHYHFDIRYMLQTEKNVNILKNHESHEIAWIKLNELNRVTKGNTSIIRMAEKSIKFANSNY